MALMAHLGLHEIDKFREELKCREGLLIDFDYAAVLTDLKSQMAEPMNTELESEDGEGEGTTVRTKVQPTRS